MSEREEVRKIIDSLPDYKMSALLLFLRGMQFDDEMEDDLYCERLMRHYLDDPDPEKHAAVSLEELAGREGIAL